MNARRPIFSGYDRPCNFGWAERQITCDPNSARGRQMRGWRTTRLLIVRAASFRTWPGWRRIRPPPTSRPYNGRNEPEVQPFAPRGAANALRPRCTNTIGGSAPEASAEQ